jgi:hypothetical protein
VRCYTGNGPMRHAFCTRVRCGVRELRAGVDPIKILGILKIPKIVAYTSLCCYYTHKLYSHPAPTGVPTGLHGSSQSMGCCGSRHEDIEPVPMAGGQRVGTVSGTAVSRDEAREKAAAAAEARAKAQQTRGQQGEKSKMKQPMTQPTGARDLSDPLVWD